MQPDSSKLRKQLSHTPADKDNSMIFTLNVSILPPERKGPCNVNATCFLTLAIQVMQCPVSIGVSYTKNLLENQRTQQNQSKWPQRHVKKDICSCTARLPMPSQQNIVQHHTRTQCQCNIYKSDR